MTEDEGLEFGVLDLGFWVQDVGFGVQFLDWVVMLVMVGWMAVNIVHASLLGDGGGRGK